MLTNHWCQWHSPNLQICLDMYLFHLGVLSKARQAAHAIINPRCKGRCNSVQNSIGAHCTHCLQCVPLSASSVQLYIHIYIYIKMFLYISFYLSPGLQIQPQPQPQPQPHIYIYIAVAGNFAMFLLRVCYVFAMCLLCFCYVCYYVVAMSLYVFAMLLLCFWFVLAMFLLCFHYAFAMFPHPPRRSHSNPLLKKAPSGRTAAPSLILCTESSHFVLRAPTLY